MLQELHHENALLSETKTVMETQMGTWRSRANEVGNVEATLATVRAELESAKAQLVQVCATQW